MRERGSATVAVAAVATLLVAVALGAVALGGLMVAGARAGAAADAAALAAAVATHPSTSRESPEWEARRVAVLNGATLLRCECRVDVSMETRWAGVAVAIEVNVPILGRVRVIRESRAEFDPMAWLGR